MFIRVRRRVGKLEGAAADIGKVTKAATCPMEERRKLAEWYGPR